MASQYYTANEVKRRFLGDPAARTGEKGKFNCYKSAPVNYRSSLKETPPRLVTEFLSDWICQNFSKYLRTMYVCVRKTMNCGTVYRQLGANGKDRHDGKDPDGPSPRVEDRIAMTYKGRRFRSIGKVLDYQVPLKGRQADEMGKIDLISYDKRLNRLYLLELKRKSTNETLLRCLLEAFAYSQSVNKLILAKEYGIPADCKVVLCPLYFAGSRLETDRADMRSGKLPAFSNLIAKIISEMDVDVAFAKIVGDNIVLD